MHRRYGRVNASPSIWLIFAALSIKKGPKMLQSKKKPIKSRGTPKCLLSPCRNCRMISSNVSSRALLGCSKQLPRLPRQRVGGSDHHVDNSDIARGKDNVPLVKSVVASRKRHTSDKVAPPRSGTFTTGTPLRQRTTRHCSPGSKFDWKGISEAVGQAAPCIGSHEGHHPA